MARPDLQALTPAELTDYIAQCQAAENVLRRDRLAAMARYDELEAWKADGASSMAAWTVSSLGYGRDTANEEVRVANALESLPAIGEALRNGAISWDQTRAATEFVTPETDTHMAAELPKFSARHVRRMARRFKPVTDDQACDAIEDRSLRMRWDFEGSKLRFNGVLPAAEGAMFEKSIDFLVRKATVNTATTPGGGATYAQHAADALVLLASQNLNASGAGARAMVSIHVDGTVLAGGNTGSCEIECGPAISFHTAKRMICDANWNVVVNGDDGLPIFIGRANRQVSAHVAREIHHRDGGCRWRGCDRQGWINIHHIIEWTDHGLTEPFNLVMLCWFHHRMVHEGRWKIEGDANFELTFIAPDGREFPEGPTPLREDLKERIDRMTELQPLELQPTGTNGGPSP